jgi:hypothetical protein
MKYNEGIMVSKQGKCIFFFSGATAYSRALPPSLFHWIMVYIVPIDKTHTRHAKSPNSHDDNRRGP